LRFANRASGIPIVSQMAKLLRRQQVVEEKPPDMEYPPAAQTLERPRTPSAVRAHEVPTNTFWTPSKALMAMLEEQEQNQTADEPDDVTGSGSDRTVVDQNDHFLVLKPPSRTGLAATHGPAEVPLASTVPGPTRDDMSLPGAVEMVPGLTLRPSTRQVGTALGVSGDVQGALPSHSRPATGKSSQAPGSTQRSGTASNRGPGTRASSARASSRSRKSTVLTIEEQYAEVRSEFDALSGTLSIITAVFCMCVCVCLCSVCENCCKLRSLH